MSLTVLLDRFRKNQLGLMIAGLVVVGYGLLPAMGQIYLTFHLQTVFDARLRSFFTIASSLSAVWMVAIQLVIWFVLCATVHAAASLLGGEGNEKHLMAGYGIALLPAMVGSGTSLVLFYGALQSYLPMTDVEELAFFMKRDLLFAFANSANQVGLSLSVVLFILGIRHTYGLSLGRAVLSMAIPAAAAAGIYWLVKSALS